MTKLYKYNYIIYFVQNDIAYFIDNNKIHKSVYSDHIKYKIKYRFMKELDQSLEEYLLEHL